MEIQNYFSATSNPGQTGQQGQMGDYQTFLNMLTVQMRNQDPLNPQSATDFAVQLATFSSVEQQTQTNQLLTALLGRAGLADLGSWVGMEARIHGGAWYDGEPVSLAPDPAFGADRAFLIVRDEFGTQIDRREIAIDSHTLSWDGVREDGMPAPNGRYTFELESRAGDTVLDTASVATYQPIIEARNEGGQTLLVLPGGLLVDSADVSGLRQPRPAPAEG